MKKLILALAAVAAVAGAQTAGAAEDSKLLQSLTACNADFFRAVAKDRNIPETLKVREGDMAYLKVEKQPLDQVSLPDAFRDSGLTVTGYIFNDEIIRYPGVPDMHTHFWGLIVKEDWKKAVDAFRLDWEAVDGSHSSAHANRQLHMNNEPGWKDYKRPENYEYPELGATERAFHVKSFQGRTMVFCSMLSAGAPDEAVMRETRPDLLMGENQVAVTEKPIEKDAEKAKMPEGHPEIPASGTLPEGHPDISKMAPRQK